MAKVLTTQQLEALRSEGAEIIRPPEKREVSLDGLESVVAQLRQIAEANQQLVQKRNDDLVRAIETLVITPANTDLQPVLDTLNKILVSMQTKVEFPELEVERNNRGLISRVKPVSNIH